MEENKINKIEEEIKNPQVEDESYYSVAGFVMEIIKIFSLALLIIIPIRIFLFQPFFVQGSSMEPNFKNGEYLIVNELGYKITNLSLGDFKLFSVKNFSDLKRGDVIVFRYPKNPRQFFIKRVIGVAGETVEVKNGKVFVYSEENPKGTRLDEEEYLSSYVSTDGDMKVTVGKGQLFVLGDNRSASSDSRSWGLVSDENVIGKVLFRAWPITNFDVYAKEISYN